MWVRRRGRRFLIKLVAYGVWGGTSVVVGGFESVEFVWGIIEAVDMHPSDQHSNNSTSMIPTRGSYKSRRNRTAST